jgi:hypothetical protein
MVKILSKKVEYPYPSRFGSHKSMVKEDCGLLNVVCVDEFGDYLTGRDRLDNGRADPNRYATSRLGLLFQSRKKE